MMEWNLGFLSEEDFKTHVRATIMKYGEKLESYDLKRFNSNFIDPIKLIFDKSVYRTSWNDIINNEIFRQRDKSNRRFCDGDGSLSAWVPYLYGI